MIRKPPSRLRISELARRAEVSVPTIKHYLREGLLPRPEKTGRTMSYYDAACVERIRSIKRLQRERFLPLAVIKRVLAKNGADDEELALGSAILLGREATGAPTPEAKVERRTGYPLAKTRRLVQRGLISPALRDGVRCYDAGDLQIIEVMKLREQRGVPLDYSIELALIYREAIRAAVDADIRLFARGFWGDVSTRQAVKLITEADEPLDRLMVLLRRKLLRSAGAEALSQMDRIPAGLKLLNFLLLPPKSLPPEPPAEPLLRQLWLLGRGDY